MAFAFESAEDIKRVMDAVRHWEKEFGSVIPQRGRRIPRSAASSSTTAKLAIVHLPQNTITASSTAAVQWGTELEDTDTMVDLGSNNTRITAKTAGWFRWLYSIDGDQPTSLDDGMRGWLAKNGGGPEAATLCVQHGHNIGQHVTLNNSGFLELAVNDYLEFILNNESSTQDFYPGNGQFSLERVTSS